MRAILGLFTLLFTVITCSASVSWAQSPLGPDHQVSLAAYSSAGHLVADASRWEQRDGRRARVNEIVVWDTTSRKAVRTEAIGALSRVEIEGHAFRGALSGSDVSPDGQRIVQIGTQYHSSSHPRREYETILHLYDVATQRTQTLPLQAKLRVQKVTFHPTDPELVGFIAMDENFAFVALTYDLKKNRVQRTLLQGQGALIPLFLTFSSDGTRAYVGYGSSSNAGGFNVHTVASGQRQRQVKLQDQPHYFFEVGDELIVSGLKTTFVYDAKSFNRKRTIQGSIGAVHAPSSLGVLTPNGELPDQPVQLFDLAANKPGRVLTKGPIRGLAMHPQGEQLAVINHHGTTQKPRDVPGITLFDLP
ncbi:MAG: hypothetical protein EA397_18035 [Deltaproteobacteria bacterium]|nr:MAG: hypothetical protein EA397_18035 [Deltaproteobacteria bacterium]